MAVVGALGEVAFSVSRNQVKTFEDFKHDSSASYSTHKRHGKTALLEFGGTDTESITFSVLLSKFLGIDPKSEAERLKKYLANGTVLSFVIGDSIIGNYKWVISKLSQGDCKFDKQGGLIAQKVTITLSSYEKR